MTGWFRLRAIELTTDASPTSSPGQVTMKIMSNKGQPLRPKLTAEARIQTGQTGPVFSVPTQAIDNAQGETRVWLINAFGRLVRRPVEVGRSNAERAEIKSGLQANDRVVTESDPSFVPGMRVKVVSVEEAAKQRKKTQALLEEAGQNALGRSSTSSRSSRR